MPFAERFTNRVLLVRTVFAEIDIEVRVERTSSNLPLNMKHIFQIMLIGLVTKRESFSTELRCLSYFQLHLAED